MNYRYATRIESIKMSNPLLRLGNFAFEGLESPERIHLKANQRLAVHHLGSGMSIADCLGDDCEVVSFRGIFSGKNTAERIRSVHYLRLQGLPLSLTWGSQALSVLIHDFELDYASDLWIPYRLSCYVVRSNNPGVGTQEDSISASPITQVGDIINLLRVTGANPISDQTAALGALARLNYDLPPPDALVEVQSLVISINKLLATLADTSRYRVPNSQGLLLGENPWITDIVSDSGQEAALILARNRIISIVVNAECVGKR